MHMKILRIAGLCIATTFLLLGAGFLWFTYSIAPSSPTTLQNADAIVVVTGKAPRIGDAINLLALGKGQRLLISGVNSTTSKNSLRRMFKGHDAMFTCCVDLDRKALNTRGNAAHSARWARRHNFKSLILVTSTYHMPRVLAEFANAMPNVKLQGLLVIAKHTHIDRWWVYPGTAKLLAVEYAKYLLALLRIHILRM